MSCRDCGLPLFAEGLCSVCKRKRSCAKSAKYKDKLRKIRRAAEDNTIPSIAAAVRSGQTPVPLQRVVQARPPNHLRNPTGKQAGADNCGDCGADKASTPWGRTRNNKPQGTKCKQCAKKRRKESSQASTTQSSAA